MALKGKYDDGKISEFLQDKVRVRISLRELAKDKVKLNAFLRAFQRIKELDVNDDNSFWKIAGYHGEPFTGDSWKKDRNSWGSYCQHGNVLFPTWHRAYMLRMENALRSVMDPGDDVTLPYWDYTSADSLSQGIPTILTDKFATIDGQSVPNPIASYNFQDEISSDRGDFYYHKPKGYWTVRYPYSGIKSPSVCKDIADKHNDSVNSTLAINGTAGSDYLNQNLYLWMTGDNMIYEKFIQCLQAPNYTLFSNTQSAGHHLRHVTALESPHNSVHLAVGGFSKPFERDALPASDTASAPSWMTLPTIPGANGDMGENETAAFDPCFFFHHCNIDRVFWLWQKSHNSTTTLDIIAGNVGSKTAKKPHHSQFHPFDRSSGPTVGQGYAQQLTLDTPLIPFTDPNDEKNYLTSRMLVDIRTQCGYDYSTGSFATIDV